MPCTEAQIQPKQNQDLMIFKSNAQQKTIFYRDLA